MDKPASHFLLIDDDNDQLLYELLPGLARLFHLHTKHFRTQQYDKATRTVTEIVLGASKSWCSACCYLCIWMLSDFHRQNWLRRRFTDELY